jgi:hypothetical protein
MYPSQGEKRHGLTLAAGGTKRKQTARRHERRKNARERWRRFTWRLFSVASFN